MSTQVWNIWRKDGLHGVLGPDTNGRIEVIRLDEVLPHLSMLRREFRTGGLNGFDFYDAIRALILIEKEITERKAK